MSRLQRSYSLRRLTWAAGPGFHIPRRWRWKFEHQFSKPKRFPVFDNQARARPMSSTNYHLACRTYLEFVLTDIGEPPLAPGEERVQQQHDD